MWPLQGRDPVLLTIAILWLGLARFSIAFFSFRRVGRMATMPVRLSEQGELKRLETIKRVRWAIAAASRRVPWRTMCFEQGLAAHLMLRRRGLPSVLYYGAAPNKEKGLAAHVWVRVGVIEIVGCEIADQFAVLAVFPSDIDDRAHVTTL